MELTFRKENHLNVAEVEVTGDFNIHIEKGTGALDVYQTSVSGGQYDFVKQLSMTTTDTVMDKDVTAFIWPKYLRMETTAEVTKAVITVKE